MVCRQIIVRGKVQGVYYRASAKDEADRLGIQGEVKNLPDGSVCIIAEGTAGQIDELIAWCYKGPPRAIVDELIVADTGIKGFKGFSVVRF
ncbi:MAG: acylphosphatase [Chitinophagaceae bacterium]|nr:acylphosphatase [Chitinophagaceae bacterium]